MTETRVLYSPATVTAPGATLAELLREHGMTQKELALRIGRPEKTISEIVNGKAAITPETAVQLEKIFETPADYWLTHEAHYRAHLARQKEESGLEAWLDWLDHMPLHELKNFGVLPKLPNRGQNRVVLLQAVLRFFAVATPADWEQVYGKLPACYRCSRLDLSDPYATAAWLRLGELQVADFAGPRFDREQFSAVLTAIRELTVLPPEEFEPRLKSLCAQAGVIVALVPAIPRAGVSGAARRVNGRPLIQLSLYGKTNDKFWFTFFHEAAHVLFHDHKLVFLDDGGGAGNADEEVANTFAASQLIPPQHATELPLLHSKDQVRTFAERLGIHPGIVVGRLQHDRVIKPSWMNELKDTLEWSKAA